MADQARDLIPTRASAPYRVSFYVKHGDDACSRVHTEECRDERSARNFAVNMLLATYMELIYPHPEESERRLFWCELVAGRLVDGQWEPDPRAGGEVDSAWLDGDSGLITFEPNASLQRWRPVPAARRG